MSLGPLEIGILILLVVLLFGAKKLPEIGRGLGSGMREFKDGVTGKDDAGDQHQLSAGTQEPPVKTPAEHSQQQPPRDAS